MLVEEASAEGGEPLLDDLVGVLSLKGMFGQIENLLRREAVADEVALELASELKKKNITLEVKGAGTVLADNKKIFFSMFMNYL